MEEPAGDGVTEAGAERHLFVDLADSQRHPRRMLLGLGHDPLHVGGEVLAVGVHDPHQADAVELVVGPLVLLQHVGKARLDGRALASILFVV